MDQSRKTAAVLYRSASRVSCLDLRAASVARRAAAGASQGRRPPLTPGQRRRRRRLDLSTAQFGSAARCRRVLSR